MSIKSKLLSVCVLTTLLVSPPVTRALTVVEIDRSEYADRLAGFWLGQTIANWTGRRTEAHRTQAPFYTDADWGVNGIDWWIQSPWQADDDTDIEYVYTHLMSQAGHPLLTSEEIRDGWVSHINRKIWVSNAEARELMDRGVLPGATSLPVANYRSHMIDAQLTTEIFGAIAPAMPEAALKYGDLPIRTTAHGHAAHASQYFQLLHTYVPLVPDGLTSTEQVQWLNQQARAHIPDTSKAADIIDYVTAEFEGNPDKDDWESTRDGIYERYQLNDAANGFDYKGWYESSVNFASGVMILLYGEGDYEKTVKIGTLSGWDSDNPTATMGGLLGLLHGEQAVREVFPSRTLDTRYKWSTTRDNLVDYLPADVNAEDDFHLMAGRMLAIIDQVVAEQGGTVDLVNDTWVISYDDQADPLAISPTQKIMARSANMQAILSGENILATASIGGGVTVAADRIADGVEHDFTGREMFNVEGNDFDLSGGISSDVYTFTVTYDTPKLIEAIRVIEGDHTDTGGWYASLSLEILRHGVWEVVPFQQNVALDSQAPFQIIDLELDGFVEVQAIRVSGFPGGSLVSVSLAELDGLLKTLTAGDIDALFDAISLASTNPLHDLDGDGVLDSQDMDYLVNTLLETNYGDSNLDGIVNVGDLTVLAAHYNTTQGIWATGDFNGDGIVNIGDLTILASHFGQSAINPVAVPEPSFCLMGLFGVTFLCRCRARDLA